MTAEQRVLNDLLMGIYTSVQKAENAAIEAGPFSDLSLTEAHTLVEIGREGSKTMGEVASALGVTVPTLSVSVKRLHKKGYVLREKSQKDRRLVLLSLTKKGIKAERLHIYFHRLMTRETIKKIEGEEFAALIRGLTTLQGFFDGYLEKMARGRAEHAPKAQV